MAGALIGEASLSASIQRLCDKIDSVELMDFFRGKELDHSLQVKLKPMFLALDAVLDDAEEEQIEKPRVGKWLDELKHAVFDAEDLLHEIDTEVLRSKVEAGYQTKETQVGDIPSTYRNPFNNEGWNGRIEDLFNKLEHLAKQKKMPNSLRRNLRGFGGMVSLRNLPNSICNLRSLRFIDLSHTGIRRLPETSLIELPADMHKLINLRLVDISGTNIKDMPLWLGKLTNLRSLSTFVERPASSFPFGVDCGSGSSPNNEIYELRHKKKAASAEWPFLLISLCLEILSVAFDQASSPSKPHYALFGMLLAIVGGTHFRLGVHLQRYKRKSCTEEVGKAVVVLLSSASLLQAFGYRH